ncbi:AraC family transcriptional regulator [Pseudomonas sp. GD03944]|uniref:AraC family transcriptional regulator n=1 Tax=Pseudomonas sp. GD03944 TaxID=2975409 RepID=UPI002449F430|nr:AraC family transcriptional regulator [Pseudomonas sp. GD03944]MDH1262456.1 AraC family transcriptional regulator [Pseudomonas sp. GD03944]
MTAILSRFAPSDGAHRTPIAPLQLIRNGAMVETFQAEQKPALYVVIQGQQEVRLRDERYRFGSLECLLVTQAQSLVFRSEEASQSRPLLLIRLDIEPAIISQLIFDADLKHLLKKKPSSGLHVEPLDLPLLEAMLRLLRLLDTPQDIAMLAPLAYKEILYRLLRGQHGHQLRDVVMVNSQNHRVAQAVEWLNQHFRQPLRIEELAQRINLCTSSLHHRFKEMTGMSPLQYQKRLRLEEAHRLMLQERVEASVACYRVGYESPSQFSREYSRFFGASPRNHIVALRRASL